MAQVFIAHVILSILICNAAYSCASVFHILNIIICAYISYLDFIEFILRQAVFCLIFRKKTACAAVLMTRLCGFYNNLIYLLARVQHSNFISFDCFGGKMQAFKPISAFQKCLSGGLRQNFVPKICEISEHFLVNSV